jgi:ribonuclease D
MVDEPEALEVAFVDDPGGVPAALASVDAPTVGVDVERADADRYFRRAALVQIGVAGRCVLFDGVTLPTLPALDEFLRGRLAVLHAVENDLEPLTRMRVVPERLADTAVAAALLGRPTGLGALLAETLGVELDGDKSAYQRADWELRPLSDGMAAYAAGDVVHLPALWWALRDELAVTGRTTWYEQELAWTRARLGEETRDWTRVKGAGSLAPSQRAILRAVWDERERLARDHDVAPNRLVHDDVLRTLAVDPPRTEAQLVRRSQRRRSLLRRHAPTLLAAVERGRVAPPEPRDGAGRRWSERERAAFDAMRRARSQVAEELGIDAGVLCPSRPLWRTLAGAPADAEELCSLAQLRPWQCELLADALWSAYADALC